MADPADVPDLAFDNLTGEELGRSFEMWRRRLGVAVRVRRNRTHIYIRLLPELATKAPYTNKYLNERGIFRSLVDALIEYEALDG